MPRFHWNRSRLLIAAVIGCLVPLVVMGPGGAAPTPVATFIRIDSVITPTVTPDPNAGDTPDIWIAVGTPFDVTATAMFDENTPAPLSTNKIVKVAVRAVTPSGIVNLGTVEFPAGATTITFSRTLSTAIDNAFIHLASVEKPKDPVREGSSGLFDVQKQFTDTMALDVAIGGTVNGTDCTPTQQSKICYEVHIPAGAAAGNHLVSVGNCTNTDANNLCTTEYWWSIVNVNASRTNPAYTDMGLDKSLKGVAFKNGVASVQWVVRPSGSEVWVDAPPCATKGVVGPDQDFCQDFTESSRDNSGDTWIRLYWIRDIRGSTK